MDKSKLSDEEWGKLISSLKKIPGIRIGCEVTCRRFVEAVLWILRAGAQWRLLPDRLGHWNSVFKRFASWSGFGVWEQILDSVSSKADLENVCIDSTVVRAHACAAGAAKSNAAAEALGRSRGGFGCKIHALTDALGLPVRFILTGGQAADITQAIPLMQDIGTSALLADKAYDADALLGWLKQRDVAAVIPPKANRKVQRSCDWHLYKERHVIECMNGQAQNTFAGLPLALRKRPAISRKCFPLLQFCCGYADTSTEPKRGKPSCSATDLAEERQPLISI